MEGNTASAAAERAPGYVVEDRAPIDPSHPDAPVLFDKRRAELQAELAALDQAQGVTAAVRQPTALELAEQDEAEEFDRAHPAHQLLMMAEPLLVEAKNQVRHNGPVSPSIVNQITAIRDRLVLMVPEEIRLEREDKARAADRLERAKAAEGANRSAPDRLA